MGGEDEYGIREEYISTKRVILGFTGDLIIYGITGPRRDPQIVLWTEERVPESPWSITILMNICLSP